MNNNLVITLERQFGSGGYEIGKKVAEKLGIPCYNKEILETAAERINIPEEYLESMQENVSQSLLYKLSLASQNGKKLDSRAKSHVVLNLYILSAFRHGQQHYKLMLLQDAVDHFPEGI